LAGVKKPEVVKPEVELLADTEEKEWKGVLPLPDDPGLERLRRGVGLRTIIFLKHLFFSSAHNDNAF
jgi:hypothetical protein